MAKAAVDRATFKSEAEQADVAPKIDCPTPPSTLLVNAAEEAAEIIPAENVAHQVKSVTTEVVVAEQTTSDREAEQGPAGSLPPPPHPPAEQDGHLPHPPQHLPPPLPPIDLVFKSFCSQALNLPPLLPSLKSPRRVRGVTAPRPKLKPSDPLAIRKAVKYFKNLQNQNIKRAVWMSGPLLHGVVKGVCPGGWVDDVSVFVSFVDSEDGLHTEPDFVYDEDFLLYLDHSTPFGQTRDQAGKNILEEPD